MATTSELHATLRCVAALRPRSRSRAAPQRTCPPQLRLRRLLIDMVLATDMKQHLSTLSKFQAKLQVRVR